MTETVSFYTPGTGLPDFEMRIALGLCATALQGVGHERVSLKRQTQGYSVDVDYPNAEVMMRDSISWLCRNSIGDPSRLSNISGFYGAILNPTVFKKTGTERFPGYAKLFARYGGELKKADPIQLFSTSCPETMLIKSMFLSCGHSDRSRIVMSAITPLSAEIGKVPLPSRYPSTRRAVKRDNLDVCPLCAALAIVGSSAFQIHLVTPGKMNARNIFSFLPNFENGADGESLARFLAASKHVRPWQEKIKDLNGSSVTLSLLAKYPHLVKLLAADDLQLRTFFVSVAEQKDQAPRYIGKFEQHVEMDIRYLAFSPHNRALLHRICEESRFGNHRGELMGCLARSLQNKDEKSAMDFARIYVATTEGEALIPKTTTKFLAKEVCRMDKSLLEGERFETVKKVSDMLQYFVRERNFGYVDNLRKARDADEFARILLDAQREAQSVILDHKKQNKPFLPGQNTIQDLLIMVNEDSKQFKSVQTLIALLAFTYYRKEA